jgi:excisionase family DNA binding protein
LAVSIPSHEVSSHVTSAAGIPHVICGTSPTQFNLGGRMTETPGRVAALVVPLLTRAEAAQLLAVRPSWIYRSRSRGTLRCLRLGRHAPFTRPMLEEWLGGRAA